MLSLGQTILMPMNGGDDYVVVQGWSGDGDGETSSVDFMSLPPHIRLAFLFLFLMS